MNTNKLTSTRIVPIIFGGLVAGVGLWYIYCRSKQLNRRSKTNLSRDKVYSVLKEYREEIKPLLKQLNHLSINHKNKTQSEKAFLINDKTNVLKSSLIDNNSEFKVRMDIMIERLYSKHNIDDKPSFDALAKELAQTDTEIAAIIEQVEADYRLAILGSLKGDDIVTSNELDELDKSTVLEIHKDALKLLLQKLINIVREHKRQLSDGNPANDMYIQEQIAKLDFEEIRLEVYKRSGFATFNQNNAEFIFNSYLGKYSRECEKFRNDLNNLDKFHHSFTQKLFAIDSDVVFLQAELDDIEYLIRSEAEIADNYSKIVSNNKFNRRNIDTSFKRADSIDNFIVVSHTAIDNDMDISSADNEEIDDIEELQENSEVVIDEEGFIKGIEDEDSESDVEDNGDANVIDDYSINNKQSVTSEDDFIVQDVKAEPVVNCDFSNEQDRRS